MASSCFCRPRRHSGSSIVVLGADDDKRPDEAPRADMLSLAHDTGIAPMFGSAIKFVAHHSNTSVTTTGHIELGVEISFIDLCTVRFLII
ncbi:hypothetical protein EVAR_6261_1 [Eumeta japonica]|uniref:Uncharacterized protein n=1 Tax=Eumeta variegata TaxID=151549 RepID=A0A4C1TBB2_EUMVA|nr:hypothetical protein EVAR_6261_1 [Eumeta japonica]